VLKPSRPLFILLGLALLIIGSVGSGCGKSLAFIQLPPEATDVVEPTPTPAGCTTAVLDYGLKGTTAAVARGAYSDTKLDPLTGYPAVGYTDAGSLTLKFNYWNGSQFVTEIITGQDSTAGTSIGFVRLAFLSTGVPMLFWTQGANVKVAIRSAALSAAGSWTAGAIDSSTAPRAVEVSINPLDQVGVVYLTDTAVAGKPRFAYCDAPCTNPGGFQVMNSQQIETGSVTAASMATGMAWCRASSTAYYPAVTYPISTGTRYAICTQSLANCVALEANWTKSNVVAGAGSVSSKLYLDPTVTGDVPKVVVYAAGMVPYKMGTTACTDAQTAFSAGALVGGAGVGSQWISFLKDATGKFHLAANENVASVRYYNNSGTDPTAGWSTAGIVETVTLPTANGGGAVVSDATTSVFISYGTQANTYDLKLARIPDYTVASATTTFAKYLPDPAGNLQLNGSGAGLYPLRNIASAKASSGATGVAYLDFSAGAATTGKLKYAYRGGTGVSDPWMITIIPGTLSPTLPSIDFYYNSKPWIAHFDAGLSRYFLVTNTLADGTGTWTTYEFPLVPAGAVGALPATQDTAVAMYYNSGTAKPVMIVIDSFATSRGIKAAMLNPQALTWSPAGAFTTIETLTASGASHLTSDFDLNGNIVIAYRDLGAAKVKYAASSNGTTWTTPWLVSLVSMGQGVDIAINPVTSKPAMSYYDRVGNNVWYSSCSGTFATCATGGWSSALVDPIAGVSTLSGANHEQLLRTSLIFTTSGDPIVVYSRGATSLGQLMQAKLTAGSFTPEALGEGKNGSLSGAPAMNFAVGAWNVSAERNASDKVTALYVGPGDWLYFKDCSN